ncbi:MAG: SDR family oxidoreductase [Thermoplasmatales archaeon]|nr:SDR family oxidoreductase [Thermoplasmatales archaeon]
MSNDINKYQKLFSLEKKVAMVTGGAGHLGSAISKALAGFGATVILLGRTEQKLKDFVNQNQSSFENRFEYFVCDVTHEKDFQKVVEKVVSSHGTIDILVNNAYAKQEYQLEKVTKEEWYQALEYSLTHYFTCSRSVGSVMLKARSGSIISIASLYGFLGTDQRIFLPLGKTVPTPIHYSVAKGGILQMTRYLATLWADKCIRVNAISPGHFPPKSGPDRPDYIHEITKRVPMGCIGQPDDLAGAVVFLASNASSYVTGQNLIVDGGWSIW